MDDQLRAGITPDTAEAVRRILLALGALTHQFGRALARPETSGLSSNADVAVLTTLRLAGPQRPRELRHRTGLTTGGLSNLFDRLEQQQLMTRTYGGTDGDRRSALVALTARGEHVADAIADAIRRTIADQSALLRRTRELIDAISDPRASGRATEPARTPLEQIERFGRAGIDLDAAMAAYDRDEPTPTKATVALCAAAAPDGTRPRDLHEVTDLSSGGVTMLLDRLEDAGLIHRTTGQPPDRRAVTVTLTDRGRRDLDDRLQLVAKYLTQIRAAVTEPVVTVGLAT